MPEFTVKEVRLPELHLPEIKRDEIVRALSGIRLPDVDLIKGDQRRRQGRAVAAALPLRMSALSASDLGKLIAAAVTAARLVRPREPRSRWFGVRAAPRRSGRRFAFAALFVGAIVGWVVLRDPSTRLRLNRAAQAVRQRIESMRANRSDQIEGDAGDSASVPTGELAPTSEPEIIAPEAPAAATA
jgi:hypothetical protein